MRILIAICVFQGNAELLSISSDDSIWNSGDEDDGEKSDTGWSCSDCLSALVWHTAILLMSYQLWLYGQCRQHFALMAMLKSLFFIASIFNTVFILSRLMENPLHMCFYRKHG